MANVSRAFDKHTQERRLKPPRQEALAQDNDRSPWEIVPQGTMPPMMFQLRFNDGSKNSFAYSDLREVFCRDAGLITLTVQAVEKYRIVLEGRHLSSLADLFGLGTVRCLQESDSRSDPKPESAAEITKITVELIPD